MAKGGKQRTTGKRPASKGSKIKTNVSTTKKSLGEQRETYTSEGSKGTNSTGVKKK